MKKAVLIALLLIGVVGSAERAFGQFFLCSAGPNDGGPCDGDADCLPAQGGACVIIQGVCDGGDTDGFPCDCPSGVCEATPVCSADPSLGTCRGGSFNTECCDPVNFNCLDNAPCVGSQKICCSGNDKGFSCLDNSQCTGSGTCVSTGRFCSGGDFDSYTCCDNSDCGSGGECIAAEVDPTSTPTRPGATATRTSPGATRTPTISVPSPTGTLPTATKTIVKHTPTRTVTQGAAITLVKSIGPATRVIQVSDASTLPPSGTIVIDGERIRYASISGNVLNKVLRGVDGTIAAGHSVGATVRLVDTPTVTPLGGPSTIDYNASADGACAMLPQSSASPAWWALVMLAAAVARIRRRQ